MEEGSNKGVPTPFNISEIVLAYTTPSLPVWLSTATVKGSPLTV